MSLPPRPDAGAGTVLALTPSATLLAQAARSAMPATGRIVMAETTSMALSVLRQGAAIRLIFCDVALDIGGFIRSLRAERITTPVIATGLALDAAQAAAAIRAGAADVLPLPPEQDLIAAMLRAAAATDSTAPVARDPAMLAVLRRAEQVAGAEASVLITGESGTGKEVLARYVHAASRRAGGPFVAVNCAAIPEALLESELFGHEKGAFSGAVARRIGKFEAADGGTLLLDEISEMDTRLQAKLLRALQEREIDRVGGGKPVRVNVRILATSNRALPEEVKRGRFREDLYFRLNVVSLVIPPLRARPGDIGVLAAHYARHYAVLNGLPERLLDAGAERKLAAHTWPGNVRELENTLHRAVLLAAGDTITAADIELPVGAPARQGGDTGPPAASYVGRTMADMERELILHTLSHTLGNRTHAATILGISIRALRNKLRDYAAEGVAVPPHQASVA
jgi:DNA-binding NtrC family response regulator